MTKENDPEVVEAPEADVAADWREAFEHAIKAAREVFNASAAATTQLFRQGGKLAEQTVSEAQRTILVTLDEETLNVLDKMVTAGVHKSRSEAIRHLIGQGMKASGDLLARIDKVEGEIEALRSKMRNIPLEGDDE